MMVKTKLLHALATAALMLAIVGGAGLMPRAEQASAQAGGFREVSVLTSAARTTTGTSATICGLGQFEKYAIQLVVSAASGTTPTLDVTWQHSIDRGTTWFTVVAFAQKTATGNELKVESEVEAGTAEVYGDCMRVSYTIGGTTPSFTFRVDLYASE